MMYIDDVIFALVKGKYIMNDIMEKNAIIWRERLSDLMNEKGYTQESFLKEYKSKYGGGTQANVSRWLRVGSKIKNGDDLKTIGFPSYENMLNIADFFGVTVGYLTGETDFETFEMEKSCHFLGIDEEIAKIIKSIVSGKSFGIFGKYEFKEYSDAFKHLLMTNSFLALIEGLKEYREVNYQKQHPIDHFVEAQKEINPDIIDLAVQCLNYDGNDENNDFKENNVQATKELLEAINILNDAMAQNCFDEEKNDKEARLCEYRLLKVYFELIKEIVSK